MKTKKDRLIRVHNEDLINGHFIVPDNIKSIWHWAFGGCTSLVSITIPSSVESIGDEAFYNCPLLKEIDVSALSMVSGFSFYRCNSLERIKLPNGNTYNCTTFKGLIFIIEKQLEIDGVTLIQGFYFHSIIHQPNGHQFLYKDNGFIAKKDGVIKSAETKEKVLELI
jgi:hypothetical protein